ncbi:MAG TPA: amidohydrolase family protein [Thermomicrobiales bacterium]|nr:amidohydrolase family protein [Thermomicrobiales bacterium]
MPTMDFEAYLPTEVGADERREALAELARLEDQAGIERAVVMPKPTPRPDNHALVATLGGDPRWVPCCQVAPNAPGAAAEVREAITALGCRMLKVMPALYNAPPAGAAVLALMDIARELGVIVNIHSGGNHSHPLEIGAVARRYPEVPIIMDHMGYRNDGRAAILAAQDNPNIYLGTTIAAFEPPFVATALAEVGPERIIFGSNAPALYPDLAVESLRRARLGAEAEALIFGENLARLLG